MVINKIQKFNQFGFTPTPCLFDLMVIFNKKDEKVWGFTIFEMIIVIAIMPIIVVLTLANYWQGKNLLGCG
ncbi:MAG: hypothetical protein A2174_00360 [Candidatus Portnoybacteria bacterium RBG_13_41_18]|uniref:Prepilin-type N-terminal cleavage/methylation domain-containing protein n=1 Tax=Candidatus Portnoybacteria bacterium RBG_13_41_18 TaxID=1801991 RepID=A0A1G2F5L5_9BACT|nr:MAG: hypothetical protein A2174_00360 [Candidatus Portnoybacteria bacterium RBG_13_41_18]